MNRWIGLGVLSVALTGCASGPWAVPDKEYVTVPPKVHVKYIVKPAPTVTVTKQEKLPQSCVLAVDTADDVAKQSLDIAQIRNEMSRVADELQVAAFEDDVKTMVEGQQTLIDLSLDLRQSTNYWAQAKSRLETFSKQCEEDGGMP